MPERAVNKDAEAKVTSLAPDVCLTPMGSIMVPVPYTITAQFDVARDTAPQVKYGGLPAFTMASRLPQVEGDEQGTGGGILSKVNRGYCRPVEHSGTVKAHKQYVVRQGDLMYMNCNGPDGPWNTFGRIEYIGSGSAGEVGRQTLSKDYKVTVDPKTGKTVVDERMVTRDPKTGAITETRQHTEIDPKTGAIQTQSGSMTTQPSGTQSYETTTGNFDPASRNFSVQSSCVEAPPNTVHISDADSTLLSDPEYQAALKEESDAQAEIDKINKELAWEAAKTTADLAGLVDPTPISDTVAAGMALSDGDIAGAGLNLLSWIPYLGDAVAKPIKGGRTAARVAKLMQRLEKLKDKLKKAKDLIEKAKARIADALRRKKGGGSPELPDPKKPTNPGDGGIVPSKPKANKPDFGKPNRRHDPCKTKGKDPTKEQNSMLDPDVDVKADFDKIGKGDFVKQGDNIIVNGRTYGYHADTGTTYPISGPGVVDMDRAQHQLLKQLNSKSLDDAMKFAANFPGLDEAKIKQVLELWKKCK
ncbi:PAAR-like domain-containing protein [Sorangium sp. So ce1153]|uniref:PAAR-like domain-containing protein n=1 Tax=Sorangium sp. So ce1153 TaxID=3133333 RepID=UPI003F62CE50